MSDQNNVNNKNVKSRQIIRAVFSNKYLLLRILKYVNQEHRHYMEINSLMRPAMKYISTQVSENNKMTLKTPKYLERPFPFDKYDSELIKSTPLYRTRYRYADIESIEWMLKNRYYALLLEKFRRKQFLIHDVPNDLRVLCQFRPTEEDLFINCIMNSEELNSRFNRQLLLFLHLYLCVTSVQSTPQDFTTNPIYLANLIQSEANMDVIPFIINQGVCVTLQHLVIALSKKRLDVFKLLATTLNKKVIRYNPTDQITLRDILIGATQLGTSSDSLDTIRFILKSLGYLYNHGGASFIINTTVVLTSILATNSVQIITEMMNFCRLKLDKSLMEQHLRTATPANASAVLEVYYFCMEQLFGVKNVRIPRTSSTPTIDNAEAYEALKAIGQKSNIILRDDSSLLNTNDSADLFSATYGNGGVTLDKSMSDTEFTEFMFKYYSLVMFGLEPFMPESDSQLPIVEYLFNSTSFTIQSAIAVNLDTIRYCTSGKFKSNLYLTFLTACANGLQEIVQFLSPKLDQLNIPLDIKSSSLYPIEYAILYRQLHIAEYLKTNRPKEKVNWTEYTIINQTGDIETLSLYQRLSESPIINIENSNNNETNNNENNNQSDSIKMINNNYKYNFNSGMNRLRISPNSNNNNNSAASLELQTKAVAIPKGFNVNSRYLQYILNYDNGQYVKYFTESYFRTCKRFTMSNVRIYLDCECVAPSSKQLFMNIVLSNWVESGSLEFIKQMRNGYPSLTSNNLVVSKYAILECARSLHSETLLYISDFIKIDIDHIKKELKNLNGVMKQILDNIALKQTKFKY